MQINVRPSFDFGRKIEVRTAPRYKVYYNSDCDKYGIQKLITDYRGTRWTQILVYRGREVAPFEINANNPDVKCYTPYRAVADRWLKSLKEA